MVTPEKLCLLMCVGLVSASHRAADDAVSPVPRGSWVAQPPATRDQVFKAFPATANLAEKADGGKVKINVEAAAADGFDPSWLRNAVYEPLDEANIDRS
jgi:hypothetical protein